MSLAFWKSLPGPHVSFWRFLTYKSKVSETCPRIWQVSKAINIPIIIDALLLLDIQIRMSSSGYVNVLQRERNREWFFSRRVKFDSGFNVMAVNEASWNGACDLRAPRQLLLGFEAHPGAITFPPEVSSQRRSSNGPIRFPHHLFSDHDHGRQRSDREPQLFPALTLAWLYIEPSPSGGVRPAGVPVDSDPGAVFEDDPTLDWTLVARWSLECVTTLGSRRSCPGWAAVHLTWILTVFTNLACTWAHFQDRWGLSSPYHVAATYPFWAARLFLLCDWLEVFATPTRRYHGRMFIHPSTPACATHGPEVFAHTQVRDPRSPPRPVKLMPWGPHLPGQALVHFVIDRAS